MVVDLPICQNHARIICGEQARLAVVWGKIGLEANHRGVIDLRNEFRWQGKCFCVTASEYHRQKLIVMPDHCVTDVSFKLMDF